MQLSLPWRYGQAKPFGSIPRINWAHPLAQGLIFYHYDAGGAGGYDLAGNRKMGFAANVPPRSGTYVGTGYHATTANVNDSLTYAADAAIRRAAPLSFGMGYVQDTSSAETDGFIFYNQANSLGSQPYGNWAYTLHTGFSICPEVNSGGNALDLTASAVAVSQNKYHALLTACPDSATLNWWVDGIAQTTVTGLNIQNVSTGDGIGLLSDRGGPNAFAGNIFWGAFWGRALTQAEALQLYLDPYCFLIYPEDEIFATLVGVAAAANVLQGSQQLFYM